MSPNRLVTGIITERVVRRPQRLKALFQIKKDKPQMSMLDFSLVIALFILAMVGYRVADRYVSSPQDRKDSQLDKP
jgi:uncharacterized protein YggT (Ycf19 family)